MAGGEHFRIVIALQQHAVQRGDGRAQLVEHVAQIGENAQAVRAVVDDEGHAVDAVMRRGNGFHRDAVEAQGLAGLEVKHIVHFAQIVASDRRVEGFFVT